MPVVIVMLLSLWITASPVLAENVCQSAEKSAFKASKKTNQFALALMRSAQKKCPSSPNIHFTMGYWFERQGRYSPAINHYRQALGKDSSHIESIGRLGVLYLRVHKFAKAAGLLSVYVRDAEGLTSNTAETVKALEYAKQQLATDHLKTHARRFERKPQSVMQLIAE